MLPAQGRQLTGQLAEIAEAFVAEGQLAADDADVVYQPRCGALAGQCQRRLHDEQAKVCGALVEDENGMMTVSSPFWIAGEEKAKPKRAPSVGQHNDEVLAAAGFNAAEIQKLRSSGVVG